MEIKHKTTETLLKLNNINLIFVNKHKLINNIFIKYLH